MSTFGVSSRYAQALLELAVDKDKFDKISADVDLVFNTLDGSKELRQFLKTPVIKEEKKISVVKELFSERIDNDSLNFLYFIIRKGRESILHEILRRFLDLRDDKIGQVTVEISSPIRLDERQRENFKAKLENFTQKKISAKYFENKDLIGGFTVKIKDMIIDASVSHKLKVLRKSLTD